MTLIDAYPDRRVIISTHAFIDTNGNRPTSAVHRPDGLSAQAVWTQLVAPNCNVDFVLNGHYHEEARRVDNNSCGEPVHQMLADFQDRIHGGDGWLRMLDLPARAERGRCLHLLADQHQRHQRPRRGRFRGGRQQPVHPRLQHGGQPVGADRHGDQRRLRCARHRAVERAADRAPPTSGTPSPTTASSPRRARPRRSARVARRTRPPVIDSVTIDQTNPRTNDTLSATVTSHDPEGSTRHLQLSVAQERLEHRRSHQRHPQPVGGQQREQGRSDQSDRPGERRFAAQRSVDLELGHDCQHPARGDGRLERHDPAGQRGVDGDCDAMRMPTATR